MDEYISKESAISIFEAKAEMAVCTPAQSYFHKAAKMIELLPAADVAPVRHGRWIPVTERLPEQGERVLATDGGFVGELYVNSRGQWKRYNVNDHSLLMALDILWWMPMPQPPKEVPENETL